MLAYGDPLLDLHHTGDRLEPHPDVPGAVAVRLLDGRYASLTPEGFWQTPADHAGPWEAFYQGANYLKAERDGGRVYVIPLAV